MSDKIKSSKELHAEMNTERAKEGKTKMPVMNNHGTSSGAIARKDKQFKGIIGTYKEVFKNKDNKKKESSRGTK